MSHQPSETHGLFRTHAITAIKMLAIAFALAALTHVSWNMFAPDLFGLPELRMKQALGLVGFGSVVAALLRHAFVQRVINLKP